MLDEIELYDLFACNQDNMIQCAHNAQDLMVAESSTPEMALEFLDILCGPRKISLTPNKGSGCSACKSAVYCLSLSCSDLHSIARIA